MTEETKKAPVMRFQGFSDDWEQRKLSEMTEYKNGKGHEDKQRTHGKYELINLNSISIDGGLKHSGKYIDDANETLKKYDLVMVLSDIGHGDLLGRVALIPEDNRFVLNQRVALLRPKSLFNPLFLFSYINQHQKYFKNQGAGMSQLNISRGSVESFSSYVPSAEEQTKIGTFFKQLDDTIALHQRMSDKQKKLKANLLQMMFPRNGEKIPEVRLAGFAEDWAQRTLEDISDKVTEKNKAREFTETLTNSAEYGIISQSDFFDKDISNINSIDGYYVVRPDDFVYNPRISNFAPVGPIKRNNLNRIGIMSPLYYVFRPKGVDHTFLEKYFETSYWHIFMKMNGDSGARADRFAIKDAILKEMPIPYPVKEEQVRIGIFFNQLDKSIALHQEKIAHLKTLKNTLLNKMFI